MGLTFLLNTAYLLPLSVFFCFVSVGSLGFRASRRRGFGPFIVGTLAAVLLVVGKFAIEWDAGVYTGIALLIAASLWNSLPIRAATGVRFALTETPTRLGSEGTSVMTTKRKVEVFSAGCPTCDDTVKLVKSVACPSCEVDILDMHDPQVATRAKSLGIRSVPAVVVDGKLADCCSGRGPDEAALRGAGLGQAITS